MCWDITRSTTKSGKSIISVVPKSGSTPIRDTRFIDSPETRITRSMARNSRRCSEHWEYARVSQHKVSMKRPRTKIRGGRTTVTHRTHRRKLFTHPFFSTRSRNITQTHPVFSKKKVIIAIHGCHARMGIPKLWARMCVIFSLNGQFGATLYPRLVIVELQVRPGASDILLRRPAESTEHSVCGSLQYEPRPYKFLNARSSS